MKNIFECYEAEAQSEFVCIKHLPQDRRVIWLAPESGHHEFTQDLMSDYDMDYWHMVLIPPGTTVSGLLWTHSVAEKQPPNTMGLAGRNIILEEPYQYGMAVRL